GHALPWHTTIWQSLLHSATDVWFAFYAAVSINAWAGPPGKLARISVASTGGAVAAGVDCAGAVDSAHPTRPPRWQTALFNLVVGGLCTLAGSDPLASAAALDHVFRLAGAVVLSRV